MMMMMMMMMMKISPQVNKNSPPEGLSQSEIEPATFQLVAQCLDQRRH
jgi:hypothetical protein